MIKLFDLCTLKLNNPYKVINEGKGLKSNKEITTNKENVCNPNLWGE